MEFPESRAVLDTVARSGKYFIGAINNEPFELNEYRIQNFRPAAQISRFSSARATCISRKPEELIFRIALRVTQRPAAQCVFIDDRPLNLESPRQLGMNVIHYQDAQQLRVICKSMTLRYSV